MQLRIDWENPYLTEEQTAAVAPGDLDDFYAAACPTDQCPQYRELQDLIFAGN